MLGSAALLAAAPRPCLRKSSAISAEAASCASSQSGACLLRIPLAARPHGEGSAFRFLPRDHVSAPQNFSPQLKKLSTANLSVPAQPPCKNFFFLTIFFATLIDKRSECVAHGFSARFRRRKFQCSSCAEPIQLPSVEAFGIKKAGRTKIRSAFSFSIAANAQLPRHPEAVRRADTRRTSLVFLLAIGSSISPPPSAHPASAGSRSRTSPRANARPTCRGAFRSSATESARA
jgi:hypothetical protein